MLVQVHAGEGIDGSERLSRFVSGTVEAALAHVASHVTRVEVHLSDENSGKGGARDKCCTLEARLENRQPDVVSHRAETLDEAVSAAAEKLRRVLREAIERMRHH